MKQILQNTAILFFPALSLLISSLSGLYFSIPIYVQEAIKHFTIGIIIATISSSFLPRIINVKTSSSRIITILGIVIGAIVISFIHTKIDKAPTNKLDNVSSTFGLYVSLNNLIDGLSIGSIFGVNKEAGLFISIATVIENIILGFNLSLSLKNANVKPPKIALISVIISMFLFFGGAVGFFLSSTLHKNKLYEGFLAFCASIFIWFVTRESSCAKKEVLIVVNSSMVYAGFLFIVFLRWIFIF